MSGIIATAKKVVATVISGEPVLNLDRSVTAESLWPTTLDKEADKAASIIRSFFVDGFIRPYRTLAMCPQEILKSCHGLAVFHLLREGLASPSAHGSGILTVKPPSRDWSSPCGILINTNGKVLEGADALDVVLVINNTKSLDLLLDDGHIRGLVATGPLPESEVSGSYKANNDAGIWIYAKSKGQLVEFDTTSLKFEIAAEENERFYGVCKIKADEILEGKVKAPKDNYLSHTLKALTEQKGDSSRLPKAGGCPGDKRVKAPTT